MVVVSGTVASGAAGYKYHYRFCIKNNGSRAIRNRVVEKERKARARQLDQCKREVGSGRTGGFGDSDFEDSGDRGCRVRYIAYRV